MAVLAPTSVSDRGLPAELAAVLAAWDLGPVQAVSRLPGGKSEHFVVAAGRGRFVVRRSYRSKTIEEVAFEHELMAYLAANGLPVPTIVPTRDGATVREAEGRLYRISTFVDGAPFRADAPDHLAAVATNLASYHRLVASFRPRAPYPVGSSLDEELRRRVDGIAGQWRAIAADPDPLGRSRRPTLNRLPWTLEVAREVLDRLGSAYDRLPSIVIHGGCRRGSTLFDGDRLVALLDFDSAHLEARTVDLAVAVHDFAKVYGNPLSADFKVRLDVSVVRDFARAYRRTTELEPIEIVLLPDLLVAKRLKRALGRYQRVLGDEPATPADVAKVELELARVRWLVEHRPSIDKALADVAGREGSADGAGEGVLR